MFKGVKTIFNQMLRSFKAAFKGYVTGNEKAVRVKSALEMYRAVVASKVVTAYGTRKKWEEETKGELQLGKANKIEKHARFELDNINKMIKGVKVNKIIPISEKKLRWYEDFMNMGLKKASFSNQIVVFDKFSNFKNLILFELNKIGVDIKDPIAVYNKLGGVDLKEAYEAWLDKGNEATHFYYDIEADPEKFISEFIDYTPVATTARRNINEIVEDIPF